MKTWLCAYKWRGREEREAEREEGRGRERRKRKESVCVREERIERRRETC